MIVRFSEHFYGLLDGRSQVEVSGDTLGEGLAELLTRYPQLYIHLLDHNGEEANKTSLKVAGEYVWEQECLSRAVDSTTVVEFGRDIPEGSGSVGKIIAGVVLIVVGILAGPAGWAALAALKPMAVGLIIAGVGMAIGGVAELIMGQPKMPMFGDGSSQSNNYTWSGIKNSTTPGTSLAVVYGEHRVGGQLLNIYTDTVDGKNNYLYAQIGLCEGEIESVSEIKVNKHPLSHFVNVETQVRYGTYNQAVMDWFNRIENTVSGDGTPIPYVASPSTNTEMGKFYQTQNPSRILKVTVSASMLYRTTSSGLNSTSVSYTIQYRILGDTAWTDAGTHTISGKSKSEVLNEHEIDTYAVNYYEIRVCRLTESHESDLNYADTIYLKSVNEMVYDVLSYPCTAMLGVKIKATEQLSGQLPTITSLVKGAKVQVPDNYDPITRTYSGVWGGAWAAQRQYTNNPVWCLYDFITNTRYGLGEYFRIEASKLGMIKAQFYLLAKYCDEWILDDGTVVEHTNPYAQPRFQLNIVIDQQKSALEWLQTLVACMRGVLYYSEGVVWLDIDRPKPITQIFNMSNIEKGSWKQAGMSYRQIPNVFEVQYPAKTKDYEFDLFRMEIKELQQDSTQEERKKTLQLVGVTDYKTAQRLARYALYLGRYGTTTYTFSVGADALQCSACDVIGVQHDVPQYGAGGRVVSYDPLTRKVTVSCDVSVIKDHTYCIKISHRGEVKDSIVLAVQPAGTYRDVYLVEDPGFDIEPGDKFIIGETSWEVRPVKIVSLKRNDGEGKVEITAISYDKDLIAASEDLTLHSEVEEVNYSSLQDPLAISVPGVAAQGRVYLAADGTVKTGLDVFYLPPVGTLFWAGAVAWYEMYGTNVWYSTPVDTTGHIFIGDLTERVDYRVVVVSAYKDGTLQARDAALASSEAPYSVVYLAGKTAPPATVQGLTVEQEQYNNNYLRFKWGAVSDLDLSHYELRKGTEWESAALVHGYIRETYLTGVFEAVSGTYTYLIKAVDTTGNYSAAAASVTIQLKVEPNNVTGFKAKQVGDSVHLEWDRGTDSDLSGYEIRQGTSWQNSVVVQSRVTQSNYLMPGVSNGTYQFFIKAVDTFGNYSETEAVVSVTCTNIAIQNIVATFDEALGAHEPSLSSGSWPGLKQGVNVSGTSLTLAPKDRYDTGLTYDSGTTYDNSIIGVGTYITPWYDLGRVMNCKVNLDYEVTMGPGDLFVIEIGTTDGSTATSLKWDELVVWDAGQTWDIEADKFVQFIGGSVTSRYVAYKITLFNNSGLLSVTKFESTFDVPDLLQHGSSQAVAVGGTTVTFTQEYTVAPALNLTTIGVGYPRVMAKSPTEFTVRVYDSNDVDIGGVVDWMASGY